MGEEQVSPWLKYFYTVKRKMHALQSPFTVWLENTDSSNNMRITSLKSGTYVSYAKECGEVRCVPLALLQCIYVLIEHEVRERTCINGKPR